MDFWSDFSEEKKSQTRNLMFYVQAFPETLHGIILLLASTVT